MTEINTHPLNAQDSQQFAPNDEAIINCPLCQGMHVQLLEGPEGCVKAEVCSCISERRLTQSLADYDLEDAYAPLVDSALNEHVERQATLARAERKAEAFINAQIPNLYCNALNESFYSKEVHGCLAEQMTKSRSQKSPLFFFYGGNGTGKTQASIFLLMHFLQNFPEKTAVYSTSQSIMEMKRTSSAYSFDAREIKDSAELKYQAALQKLKSTDFLAFDELGQYKLTDAENKVIFDILNHRYASNKVTILISNHSDTREQSLDRKLLSSLVGDRISSRVKSAKAVYFSGRDHRMHEECKVEALSKEEIARFNMGDASPKLMTLDDNAHHIMTWLTRNPAFETVDTKRRKALTKVIDNRLWDVDRSEEAVYKDVWGIGTSLIITGPVCDQEDMKLYACLLKELTENHKKGIPGLVLRISAKSILRLLDLQEAGENVLRVQRQLNRLARMSLTFRNAKGKAWVGPLLTEVESESEGKLSKLRISFSHFTIAFYRAHEYTTVNKDVLWTLSGDSATLFAFYTSHEFSVQRLPVSRLQQLLAIPETTTKKAVVRRIQNALKKLLATGIFDTQETKFKNDVLYTIRSSSHS